MPTKYNDGFLFSLRDVLQDGAGAGGIVVEIGTRFGAWSRQVLEALPGVRVFCIDPWPRREHRGLRDTFPTWYRQLQPWAFTRCFPLRGTSQEWGRVWPEDLRPHVVFVDGDHHRAAVRDDAKIWWPLVRPGGAIYFHDAQEPDVGAGIADWMLDVCESGMRSRSHLWGPAPRIVTMMVRKPAEWRDPASASS